MSATQTSMYKMDRSGRNWLILTLILAASSRILALTFYDVPGFPDSNGYRTYADMILNDPEFWEKINISGLTVTGLRSIGYPGLLAIATGASGDARETALQFIQCLAFTLACWPLFAAANAVLKSPVQAFLTVMSITFSYGVAFDLAILPDGLFKSAWIASAALAILLVMKPGPYFRTRLITISSLFILMVSLRGNGNHMALLLFPLIGLAVFANTKGLTNRLFWLGMVFIPMFFFQAGISSWNEKRAGTYFYTAGGALALMQPVTKMQARDPEVVSGPGELPALMRELNPTAEYAPLYAVVEALNKRHGYSLVEIQSLATSLYLQSVVNHPGIFFQMFVRNFDDKFALGLVNPALGFNEGDYLITNDRVFPGFSKIFRGALSLPNLLYGLTYLGFAILSVLLTVFALFITPCFAVKRLYSGHEDRSDHETGRHKTVFAVWISLFLGIAYYCALFVELRYLAAFQPFAAILGLYCANTMVSYWRDRRTGKNNSI